MKKRSRWRIEKNFTIEIRGYFDEETKRMMLNNNCNRICVWDDEGNKYKRFDFVGWENEGRMQK